MKNGNEPIYRFHDIGRLLGRTNFFLKSSSGQTMQGLFNYRKIKRLWYRLQLDFAIFTIIVYALRSSNAFLAGSYLTKFEGLTLQNLIENTDFFTENTEIIQKTL